MKKLLLTLVLAFAGVFAANAQGWIGGSASGRSYEGTSYFAFAPEFGYTIPETRWTIASQLMFAQTSYKNYGQRVSQSAFVFAPYVRYGLGNVEKFGFFLDLTSEFAFGDYSGYRIGLQPGVAFNPTKHWTAAFRFAFLGYSDCDLYDVNGFQFDFATAAPSFGLYYNF